MIPIAVPYITILIAANVHYTWPDYTCGRLQWKIPGYMI